MAWAAVVVVLVAGLVIGVIQRWPSSGQLDIASVIGEIQWGRYVTEQRPTYEENRVISARRAVGDAPGGPWYMGLLLEMRDQYSIGIQHDGTLDGKFRPHGQWSTWSTPASHEDAEFGSWWWHGERVTNREWHLRNGDRWLVEMSDMAEAWLEKK